MSDPSVEAAQRAWERPGEPANPDHPYWGETVAAAREALRPIKKWYGKAMAEAIAEDLYEQLDLLESLAPLIFTTEELNQ
ncbi:hypothetical protein PP404_24515 [Mycobacteroides abscessus]|nr:hypothetical protein [Mycobacteroides abscessus]MDM2179552.1 hypothetical protein [Mycobacteroides abscessus]MDM2209638.1 hypothetical protein [Mycobacteroides abscessus]MDM2214591.1 hypothetical protein [Mycobacteroides abscessus]MDM2219585.1 hypothetical protein [Mycobacteroides abscessus]